MNTDYYRIIYKLDPIDLERAEDGYCKHIERMLKNILARAQAKHPGVRLEITSPEFNMELAATTVKCHMVGETDSFGPLVRYLRCDYCQARSEEEHDAELVICDDCGGEFPRSETIAWKWWDFYAQQGDEPVIVCKCCRKAPKHIDRVRRNREDELYESGCGDTDYED